MEIKPFKYFFTGNWAFSPSVIDIKDVAFIKSLFGKPSITTGGIANVASGGIGMGDTFFIATQPGGNDMVTINQIQLQIIGTDVDLMQSVIEKLEKKMVELNPRQFNFSFISTTLSIECEVGNFNSGASKWLSQRFIENNIEIIDSFNPSSIYVADIMFVIQKEVSEKITIQIQPRVNKEDYLFFKITEDRELIPGPDFYKEISTALAALQVKNFDQIKKIISNGL